MHGYRGACVVAGGCMVVGGVCGCRGGVVAGGGMRRMRRDTVNERAVHILLVYVASTGFYYRFKFIFLPLQIVQDTYFVE